MTTDTAYVTGTAVTVDPFAVIPPLVTPGNPIEAEWGNEVAVALAEHDDLIAKMIPTGTIFPYAGAASPIGKWALCDGAEKSPTDTTFAALFAVIGYTYGQNGTLFKLPDLRGRMPLGWSGNDALGKAGGARNAIIPNHQHPIAQHQHTGGTHYHKVGSHMHYVQGQTVAVVGGFGTAGTPSGWAVTPGVPYAGLIYGDANRLATAMPGTAWSASPDWWPNQSLRVDIPGHNSNAFAFDVSGGAADTGSAGAVLTSPGGTPNTDNPTGGQAAIDANLPPYLSVNYIVRL